MTAGSTRTVRDRAADLDPRRSVTEERAARRNPRLLPTDGFRADQERSGIRDVEHEEEIGSAPRDRLTAPAQARAAPAAVDKSVGARTRAWVAGGCAECAIFNRRLRDEKGKPSLASIDVVPRRIASHPHAPGAEEASHM